MRISLAIAALASFLQFGVRGADGQSIPPHPRQLRYPERPVTLPRAEGRRVVLTQGTVLYLVEDHTLPLVEMSLAIQVGGFLDPAGKTGLSFLTGSQLRRGGAGEWAAGQFDDRTDDLGARLDSLALATRSGASLSVPSWNLEEGLDLFFAMIFQPRFQEDRLAAAESNLLESMSRRNQDALEILDREWSWLMFGRDHFSTRPLTPATLTAIHRQDLIDFHRRFWRPGPMILAISGDFDRQQLVASLEERFARQTPPSADDAEVHWPPPPPTSNQEPGLFHYEMDIPQAKVMLGHRFTEWMDWSARDRSTLSVVSELLGGQGAISRIAGRLRTAEGLVYRASATVEPGALWPGQFQVFFDTRNQNVSRAVELILEELDRLRHEPVHPRELEVVKESLLARHRLRFDTAEEVAGYFAEDELLGRPHDHWQDYLDAVADVTPAEVRQAASRYLQPQSLSFLVVGRWTEIAGRSAPGSSALERITGHRRTPLPARDPLTLEPSDSHAQGAEIDADRSHAGSPR